jgi:hypothetical protein
MTTIVRAGLFIPALSIFLMSCATMRLEKPEVSILTDLDLASADRSFIVESIAADKQGRLYLPDRVTGNILRVDPKSPQPVVVGRIDGRELFDTARRDNLDANNKTAPDGIGGSIAQITP